MSFFKKKKDNIAVLKKTRPGECGGTDATLDRDAPKEISSDKTVFFDVTSALGWMPDAGDDALGYVSAFAAPTDEGSFLLLSTGKRPAYREKKETEWALVKADVFHDLAVLVRELGLARNNGFHSKTHGLPENFGGNVDIRYDNGETISISDNQTPVLNHDEGARIAAFFKDALAGERAPIPRADGIVEIRFSEERENGGFTTAILTIKEDGTATNAKRSRYDGPTVYESEKEVDAGTVAAIRGNIDRTGLLAWATLPWNGFRTEPEKALTFVTREGREITVKGGRLVPDQLRNGFFNVELEITTKN